MYHRTGTLFEDRFQSKHIDKDSYLIHLCRYFHRNPIDGKKPLVATLEDWPYSNYLEWVGKRKGSLFSAEFVHSYFPDPKEYSKFVNDYTPPKKTDDGLKPYLLD